MPVLAALKKAEQRRRNRDELDSSDDEQQPQPQSKKPKNSADAKAMLKNKKKNNKMMSEEDISSEEEDDEELFEDEEEDLEEEEEIETEDGEEQEEKEQKPKQTAEVKFVEPNNWVERMSLVALKPLPDDIDPEDDPRREEAFVQHALLSVQRGIEMLDRAKVPWRRPDDYYAEMYKSDVHMDKIRRAIESTKTAVQERMKRRMIKEQKQYGKQVQADVLRQRAQDKRAMMAKIQEVRKKTGRNNDDRANKLDELLGSDDDDDNGGRGGRNGGGGGSRKSRHSARGAAFRGKSGNNVRPGGSGGKRGGGGGGRPGKNKRRH